MVRFASAMIGAAAIFAARAATAQYSLWCAVYTGETGSNCAFATREQCAAVAGIKGICIPNARPAPADRPALVAVPPVRQQPHTKPAATKAAPAKSGPAISRTASTGVSIREAARQALPLPDAALLVPLPVFDCESKTMVADASVSAQAGAPRDQPDSGAAGALQAKLDYERQCYRHAAIIADERLRRLQDSLAETIKRLDSGARSAIPLPDRTLLAPPAEFDCEFKTAGTGAEGALRIKLDYERQCYRHAEMIARDRLQRLQIAAGETIKAGQRNAPPAKPGNRKPPRVTEQQPR
jgi:hypothetical protein